MSDDEVCGECEGSGKQYHPPQDKADARIAELERQLAQSDAVISTLDVRRLVFAHPIDSPISPHWASVSEAIERHRVRVTVKAEGKP